MRYFSVYEKDEDVLKAMAEIHLRNERWYELDCTFSKGVFWYNIQKPKIKSDLVPLFDDVIQCDTTNMNCFDDSSLNSIVFDPPFLFRKRKSKNNDKISDRFTYFKSYDDLILMYEESLIQFYRILKNGGYVFVKCQDMTDGKFYCTHYETIKIATKIGFELKDIGIKVSNKKLQREAKQQNCFAKTHCYWLVFKKHRK